MIALRATIFMSRAPEISRMKSLCDIYLFQIAMLAEKVRNRYAIYATQLSCLHKTIKGFLDALESLQITDRWSYVTHTQAVH